MRQRKIKNLDEKLALRSEYIIEEPERLKGRWAEFTGGRPLMMEIGCGKGKFLSEKASGGSGEFWLGVEGHRSVALHAIEKAEAVEAGCGPEEVTCQKNGADPENEAGRENVLDQENGAGPKNEADQKNGTGLKNVAFVLKYINSLEDLFEDGEVSGIFLNFSDPWPKDRHEKRRLTTGKRLAEYARVLCPGGTLEFKTDNDGLFEYTLGEIEKQDALAQMEMTRDLHGAGDRNTGEVGDGGRRGPAGGTRPGIVTTEYEEKFAAEGKNINYLKLMKR